MDELNRRKFLGRLAAAVGYGFNRSLAAVKTPVVAPALASATVAVGVASASGAASYSSRIRAQVLEVIVRQAAAGAPWKEICAGPMEVNEISPAEVEDILKKRQNHAEMVKQNGMCLCDDCRVHRISRSYLESIAKLKQINHRAESPCACEACYSAVLNYRQEICSIDRRYSDS